MILQCARFLYCLIVIILGLSANTQIEKLGAYTMEHVATGAHLLNPQLFETPS